MLDNVFYKESFIRKPKKILHFLYVVAMIFKQETPIMLFDVSIIVLTYNPDMEKLYTTLDSIVTQKEIDFEIIVCDDGSKRQYKNELIHYFSQKSFNAYTLMFSRYNRGTVENYYSGLTIARGKYAKAISPGDFFVDEMEISEWIQYIKKRNVEWSFSDVYYHRTINGQCRFIRDRAHPQILSPYLDNRQDKCRWNYVVLKDVAIGAAVMGTTKAQLLYCQLIYEKGIRYAEDLIWRLMMFYGIVGCYYPKATICYEYGTGISTSSDTLWKKRLHRDWSLLKQIMIEEKNVSELQENIIISLLRAQKHKICYIQGEIYYWLKCHFHPRMTVIPEIECKKNAN